MCCCVRIILVSLYVFIFFFFIDTATTEIYTLSLHDALPISGILQHASFTVPRYADGYCLDDNCRALLVMALVEDSGTDRKSTRLNSSHSQISYAVFCLKKKKKI